MNTLKLEILIELLIKANLVDEDIFQKEFDVRIEMLEEELQKALANQINETEDEPETKEFPQQYFGEAGEA